MAYGHAVKVSSLPLPAKLSPRLPRHRWAEAPGPGCAVCHGPASVLGAWRKAEPLREQVLAGSRGIREKRRQQAERRA